MADRELYYKILSEILKMMSVARNIGRGSVLTILRDTMERIRALEDEKKNILTEMVEIKKLAESRVAALESEVSMLREELASSKTLLGVEDKVSKDPPAPKMEKQEKERFKFKILR